MTVDEMRNPPLIGAASQEQEKKKGLVPVRGRIKRLMFASAVRKVKLMVRSIARFVAGSGEA